MTHATTPTDQPEMHRERLTPDRIRRAACPSSKSQAFVFDTEAPRLAVRITARGAKAFIFESKLNRTTIRVTIGDVKDWNLDDARSEARRLQTLVDKGTDPRIEKADRIAETEARRTRKRNSEAPALEAWKKYLEARRHRWSERHYQDHLDVSKEGGEERTRGRRPGQDSKTQPGALRTLLQSPLGQIHAKAVRDWITQEASRRPTHAALAYRLLRAFLNWCAEQDEHAEHVHADACSARIVRDEVPAKRVKDDCLQREQLRPWFAKVREIPNPVIAAYLQVALLTGARREELAGMKWEDVDFRWKSLTIHDKVEGERTIPLTPYVASLLRGLKARNETPPQKPRKLRQGRDEPAPEWKPSPWVFPSPKAASGRLQEPRLQHNRACTAAGIDALTIHGLRRSFGTLSEWVECPAGVVAQIMGHKPSATAEKHYRRRPLDLLRLWHVKIEGWFLEQADISQPTDDAAPKLQAVNS